MFDKALMLLRERMGSKKLLLKQREAAEALVLSASQSLASSNLSCKSFN